MQQIKSATVAPNYQVELTFADKAIVRVDFAPIIARGGVFAQLADPAVFSTLSIGEAGRYLEWPGDIDFCADSLRQMAISPSTRHPS